VRRGGPVYQTCEGNSRSGVPFSAVLFDSTYGAGICEECRQIIEFGEDGSYSAGQGLLFGVYAVVCGQQKDRQLRLGCFELLSQL